MPQPDSHPVIDKFNKLSILVVGDVMVDAYIFGKVERISPEAPVPVVNVESRVSRLGGAANVALNLKSLGAKPVLCSVIGADLRGDELLALMAGEKMVKKGILRSRSRITTTKFRVIGNKTQLLRVDEEMSNELIKRDENDLLGRIYDILAKDNIRAIVLQDYDKGILTPALIAQVTERANSLRIPIVVDPKKRNFAAYKDVSVFKPNLKELREGLNVEVNPRRQGDLEKAAEILHHEQRVRTVMVTLSELGVFVSTRVSPSRFERRIIPAHVRRIADVSGAGDTMVSVAALCLASGMNVFEMASVANLAGGLVCEEIGVVPVDRKRLGEELSKMKW